MVTDLLAACGTGDEPGAAKVLLAGASHCSGVGLMTAAAKGHAVRARMQAGRQARARARQCCVLVFAHDVTVPFRAVLCCGRQGGH